MRAAATMCEKSPAADAADAARAAAADAAAYAADAAYYAADSARAAYYAADAARADDVLRTAAGMAIEVLIEMKSPGCRWLDLCQEIR